MGNIMNPITTDKALMGESADKIIPFRKRKPHDIQPYINFDKGWKFTEDDKEFLLNFYKEYLEFCQEECDGDWVEEAQETISSIEKDGVLSNKFTIQCDAEKYALGFGAIFMKNFLIRLIF